jgi:hypothetical protein
MKTSTFVDALIFIVLASVMLFEVMAVEPLPKDMLRALFSAGAVYEGF